MSDIAAKLIQATKEGCFLQTVYMLSMENPGNTVTEKIIELHNEDSIDAIGEFKNLTRSLMEDTHFWFTRNVLERALPSLNAPTQSVMDCIKQLSNEAGTDLAPAMLLDPFIEYCIADHSRANSTFEIIEKSPTEWQDFLAPCLMAGARLDFESFHEKALRLITNNELQIRKKAIFSLGKFTYSPNNKTLLAYTIQRLNESVNNETDDDLLANTILTIFSLYLNNSSLENDAIETIDIALTKSSNLGLHAASEILRGNAEKLSLTFLDMLFNHLNRVTLKNKWTLVNIDLGISKLNNKNVLLRAFSFIENLLIKTDITIASFPHAVSSLCQVNREILNTLATHWLLNGDIKLCWEHYEFLAYQLHQRFSNNPLQ